MIPTSVPRRDNVLLRVACIDDVAALEDLIVRSARVLSTGFYSGAQIEGAIAQVFGVDTQIVADGTYFIAEDGRGRALGCGGWSRRTTLFGGDRIGGRTAALLDPARDAARIRAFFVASEAARQGLASRILAASEAAALDAGFRQATLVATLPGVPFYARHGYVAGEPIVQPCGDTIVPFVPMMKALVGGGDGDLDLPPSNLEPPQSNSQERKYAQAFCVD